MHRSHWNDSGPRPDDLPMECHGEPHREKPRPIEWEWEWKMFTPVLGTFGTQTLACVALLPIGLLFGASILLVVHPVSPLLAYLVYLLPLIFVAFSPLRTAIGGYIGYIASFQIGMHLSISYLQVFMFAITFGLVRPTKSDVLPTTFLLLMYSLPILLIIFVRCLIAIYRVQSRPKA